MNDLVTIISTVGFPIFSFLLAAYFIKYTYDKSYNSIIELATAVNHNTEVLTELVEEMRKK